MNDAAIGRTSTEEILKRGSRFLNGEGLIQAVPAKQSRKIELLDYIALRFEADRRYTEKEINAVLTELYYDFPYLRRLLIENNYLDRDASTGMYWKLDRTPL